MKLPAVLITLALVLTWATPPAAAPQPPLALPPGDGVPGDGITAPDVIGVIAVLSAYALLWGAFAVALKIRALLDDDENGSSSEAISGPLID